MNLHFKYFCFRKTIRDFAKFFVQYSTIFNLEQNFLLEIKHTDSLP